MASLLLGSLLFLLVAAVPQVHEQFHGHHTGEEHDHHAECVVLLFALGLIDPGPVPPLLNPPLPDRTWTVSAPSRPRSPVAAGTHPPGRGPPQS